MKIEVKIDDNTNYLEIEEDKVQRIEEEKFVTNKIELLYQKKMFAQFFSINKHMLFF